MVQVMRNAARFLVKFNKSTAAISRAMVAAICSVETFYDAAGKFVTSARRSLGALRFAPWMHELGDGAPQKSDGVTSVETFALAVLLAAQSVASFVRLRAVRVFISPQLVRGSRG